jgi:argininosuccinate lyase
VDTLLVVLPAFHKTIATAQFKRERMAGSLSRDFSTATDLADYLVRAGMAFREAHHVVGRIVRDCIERGIGIEDLSREELAQFSPAFDSEACGADAVATVEASVAARAARGGTARPAVEEQMERARQALANRAARG